MSPDLKLQTDGSSYPDVERRTRDRRCTDTEIKRNLLDSYQKNKLSVSPRLKWKKKNKESRKVDNKMYIIGLKY